MPLPPDRLAAAAFDVTDQARSLVLEARVLVEDAERLADATVELGTELYRLDEATRRSAALRARDRAALAALASERVYPIAATVLESYPHPGLVRIGVRLVLLGMLSWLRRT